MNQHEDEAWVSWLEHFEAHYDTENYENATQSKIMHTGHKLAEKAFDSTQHFSKVIEIGAGTGEHIQFVNHTFDEYTLSDLNSKALNKAKEKLAPNHIDKINYSIQNAANLNFKDDSFDRLIATHVLEHIPQPHLVLKEWARLVKKNGIITILIPTDPGIAWRLGRHFGPRRKMIEKGIAYDYVMAREHINPCNNLIALIEHYFDKIDAHWWPLGIRSIDLNLFYMCHIKVKK